MRANPLALLCAVTARHFNHLAVVGKYVDNHVADASRVGLGEGHYKGEERIACKRVRAGIGGVVGKVPGDGVILAKRVERHGHRLNLGVLLVVGASFGLGSHFHAVGGHNLGTDVVVGKVVGRCYEAVGRPIAVGQSLGGAYEFGAIVN